MPPTFAISTHWNARHHTEGERVIEEILETTGLTHVELGYDLTLDLVPGIKKMVADGAVRVNSVHNFCPVPMGAPQGHPELFVLASPDPRVREGAVRHTTATIQFAAEIGARVVVCHAGNVEMRAYTRKLIRLAEEGKQYSPRFERTKTKLLLKRDQKVPPYLDHLEAGIAALLPELERTGIALAFENLPTWEAIPTEMEIQTICQKVNSPHIRHWHDLGHGQIRQNLGLTSQKHWISKLSPWLAGFHVHDVAPPAHDHLMPPDGQIDFAALAPVIPPQALKVLEPAPGTPPERIRAAIAVLNTAWASVGDTDKPPPATPVTA
ncbi:MAG: sugar phosphate isomerase/epimerase [Verrucomicrobia bacterium]|nr:sugar phosphate isomerase/epimerase [Verrucomicrobiota bacterium]